MTDLVPTLTDIKKKIPVYCFKPNIYMSLYYVFRNLIMCFILGYAFYMLEFSRAQLFVAPFYWYLQGTLMWGLFTIGHDCGHNSFSRYDTLNWIMGNFLHTIILTPYEQWRLSHKSHHKHTGNIDRDEIFYPNPPLGHKISIGAFGLSWFLYLLTSSIKNRINYYSSLKDRKLFIQLIVSYLSIIIMILVLGKVAHTIGTVRIINYYFAPLVVFACWLVMVTFLHHNDTSIPWYKTDNWNISKGSLSSIDRDYGAVVNNVTHHINLHQIHHLFSKIPHYYLEDATTSFIKYFPHLHKVKKGSNIMEFIYAVKNWIYVNGKVDAKGVFWYKN